MTYVWMRLVAVALRSTPEVTSFTEFAAAHPQLLEKGALQSYYSDEGLKSAAARAGLVEPDLRPLP